MALRPLAAKHTLHGSSPTFISYLDPSCETKEAPKKLHLPNISRRGAIAAVAQVLMAREAIANAGIAYGLEFRMVAPEQTIEEAESGVRDHAQALLNVKTLIESQLWGDAQKVLRKSSSYLKQDIYTIIQGKPASQRPHLRKLYSTLFNNVTRLDYAARDKDGARVQECYENIVAALDDILSRI